MRSALDEIRQRARVGFYGLDVYSLWDSLHVLRDYLHTNRPDALPTDPEAQQNAEVVAGAERYYRAMVRADHRSWNVRACHMVDTRSAPSTTPTPSTHEAPTTAERETFPAGD